GGEQDERDDARLRQLEPGAERGGAGRGACGRTNTHCTLFASLTWRLFALLTWRLFALLTWRLFALLTWRLFALLTWRLFALLIVMLEARVVWRLSWLSGRSSLVARRVAAAGATLSRNVATSARASMAVAFARWSADTHTWMRSS